MHHRSSVDLLSRMSAESPAPAAPSPSPIVRLQTKLHFDQSAVVQEPSPTPTRKRLRTTASGPFSFSPAPEVVGAFGLSVTTFPIFGAGVVIDGSNSSGSSSAVRPWPGIAGAGAGGGLVAAFHGSKQGRNPFDTCPESVILACLGCLSPADLGHMAVCNKSLSKVCVAEGEVWKRCWQGVWNHSTHARDAVTWYGSIAAALRFQRRYCLPPRPVDDGISESLREGAVAVTARHETVSCLTATAANRVVLGWSGGTLQVMSNDSTRSVSLPGGSIRHIQEHGGEMFVASWAGVVHVVDVSSMVFAVVVADLPHPLHALQMTADLLLLSCGDGNIVVFKVFHEADTGAIRVRKLQVLSGHVGAITDMHLEKGFLTTAGVDKTVR